MGTIRNAMRGHILVGPSSLQVTAAHFTVQLDLEKKSSSQPTTRPSLRPSLRYSPTLWCSTMGSATKPIIISIFLLLFFFTISLCKSREEDPTPTPWPHQFHSILFMNYSGSLQMIDLWYDWPKGRNFNIIQDQLGKLLYDLEWNNGTSFFYTLDSNKECRTAQVEVGILRPNWLDGAKYLGQRGVDGFLCNVWEKVDFIWYYEDVVTKRPVHWEFYTGRNAHVMTFEVGAVLEDARWQAPVYCFEKKRDDGGSDPTAPSVTNQLFSRAFTGWST